ncbi:MAG: MarR family winged helix-turn-helix transcriptional regulator [Lachnospiraceae bacterium]|jgi:DNA-binding MarR family transcriptional regulator
MDSTDSAKSNKQLFEAVYTRFKLHFYKEVFRNFETREATLTTVETFCMEVIYALGSPTVNEFAEYVGISSPNASYKVNNLVRKGYLTKETSLQDKRQVHLKVTQKYLDYLNISETYVQNVLQRMEKRITPEQSRELKNSLLLLLDEMKNDLPETPEIANPSL